MQGFNMGRYYAPSTSSPPRFNTSSHPLGQRARKIDQGILTVRFEMPFAIWCTTCTPENIIGQGVRFNAEKKRVGKYHSTPIWEFRMRHATCSGTIVIRTDPQSSEYVVTEGARRRDTGSREMYQQDVQDGTFEIVTAEEKEQRRQDAFAAFEGKKAEAELSKAEATRIAELRAWREKDWADPYAANKRLRRPFRQERKEREKEEQVKEGLQEKYGLGFDIVDGKEEDAQRAKMIEFGHKEDGSDMLDMAKKPLFGRRDTTLREPSRPKAPGTTKAAHKVELSKRSLQQTLEQNTRAALDPFLSDKRRSNAHSIAGIKRRRTDAESLAASHSLSKEHSPVPKAIAEQKIASLVDYASDED